MSLQFSDTTNRIGIIETIEDNTQTQTSTSSSYSLAKKTRDVNLAYARYMMLAIQSGGRMQVDDNNQSDYPILTFNLVSGQDNYAFTNDGASTPNQILDFRQLRIKDPTGNFILLTPIDRESDDVSQYQGMTGTPRTYDQTANGIIFYPTPNYNSTNGGEIYVSRTPVYFLTSDTTKTPGIPDMFHEYLALRPSYYFCLRKGMKQAKDYAVELQVMERMIQDYYSKRARADKPRLNVRNESNK